MAGMILGIVLIIFLVLFSILFCKVLCWAEQEMKGGFKKWKKE